MAVRPGAASAVAIAMASCWAAGCAVFDELDALGAVTLSAAFACEICEGLGRESVLESQLRSQITYNDTTITHRYMLCIDWIHTEHIQNT